jgi:hypothetical protein
MGDLQEKSGCMDNCQIVRAMHPASRHPDIMQNLNEAARQLRDLLKQPNVNYANGKRGVALARGCKSRCATPLAEAEKLFAKIIKSKIADG